MSRGRPKKLDEAKRAHVLALVAAGIKLSAAARLVDCDPNTVRNEAHRNRAFARELRRARTQAQIHPLRTMQQAAATNWRAAAWWLERLAPKSFAQSADVKLGQREANKFVADLIQIIDRAVASPVERARLTELLSVAMPTAMRRAWDYRQSRRQLRHALKHLNDQQLLGEDLARQLDEELLEVMAEPDRARDPQTERDSQTERNLERMLATLGQRLADRDPPQPSA